MYACKNIAMHTQNIWVYGLWNFRGIWHVFTEIPQTVLRKHHSNVTFILINWLSSANIETHSVSFLLLKLPLRFARTCLITSTRKLERLTDQRGIVYSWAFSCSPSHSHGSVRVVRTTSKVNGKCWTLTPKPPMNPLSDRHQIWRAWLRHRYLPPRKNWAQSVKGFLLPK